MGRYNVIITPDAAADLSQIKSYIAYTLQAPDTALKYIRGYGERLVSLIRFLPPLRLFRMNRGIRAESEESFTKIFISITGSQRIQSASMF